MAPIVAVTSEELQKKMIANGNGHVLKIYQERQILRKQHISIIMRDAAQLGFEKFGFELGKKANVTMIASATMCLFPQEFPAISMLVPSTGRNSSLYNAANNRVRLERKKEKEAGVNPNDEDDVDEHENAMTMEEHLTFLKSAHIRQKEAIENSLKYSFVHRKSLLTTPEYDIKQLVFNIFLCEDNYISYEYALLLKHKKVTLVDPIIDINRLIKMELLQEIMPALRHMKFDIPHEVKPFFSLFKILGIPTRACEYFFELYPTNTPSQQILESSENTQPFILGKYDTQKENVTQYFIVFHPWVIPMKKPSFVHAFDILFKVYNIFDIKYPAALEKFFKFFEEVFYAIQRHDIPLNVQIYHKIMKIHETLESKRGQENSEMIEEESQDSESDEDEYLSEPENMEISNYVTIDQE